MPKKLLLLSVVIMCLLLALLNGCTTAAPEPPTPEPTATLMPPTATLIPPTATPVPPTLNPLQAALTQGALTAHVATPIPTTTPGPTSCAEVEGHCLWLSFDGESCTYEGPIVIKTGPVTLLFRNKSEVLAGSNLLKHTGGKTIQDAIDYFGEEPSKKHAAAWSVHLPGVYRFVLSGMSYTWEGVLEPGIHHMVCIRDTPFGVWFGTGLMVEN
jgi:hypothetical protein